MVVLMSLLMFVPSKHASGYLGYELSIMYGSVSSNVQLPPVVPIKKFQNEGV